MNETISREHLHAVCKPNQGESTCRFLVGSSQGILCAKNSDLTDVRSVIEHRFTKGTIGAKGDNCAGWENVQQP